MKRNKNAPSSAPPDHIVCDLFYLFVCLFLSRMHSHDVKCWSCDKVGCVCVWLTRGNGKAKGLLCQTDLKVAVQTDAVYFSFILFFFLKLGRDLKFQEKVILEFVLLMAAPKATGAMLIAKPESPVFLYGLLHCFLTKGGGHDYR